MGSLPASTLTAWTTNSYKFRPPYDGIFRGSLSAQLRNKPTDQPFGRANMLRKVGEGDAQSVDRNNPAPAPLARRRR
jgi:hypothetical protein